MQDWGVQLSAEDLLECSRIQSDAVAVRDASKDRHNNALAVQDASRDLQDDALAVQDASRDFQDDAVAVQDASRDLQVEDVDLLEGSKYQADQAVPNKHSGAIISLNDASKGRHESLYNSAVRETNNSNTLSMIPYNKDCAPVLCANPVLTISEQLSKNEKLQTLSGLEYKSNIALPQRRQMNFQDIVIENCVGTRIGTEINTNELVINQHVDLSNLHKNDKLNLTDSSYSKRWCMKLRYVWVTLLLSTVITGAVIAASLIFLKELPEPLPDDSDNGDDVPRNYSERLISQAQWSQHPNPSGIPYLPIRPARYVIACHSVSSFCRTPSTCQNIIRSVEAWNINIGYLQVGYNFLIGGDGYIYEGRGWNKMGAHTKNFNCASIGVGFVGNFDRDILLPGMVEAYKILVEEGVRRGALTEDYKLFGAKQVKASTSSPGANIMDVIKSWPHWATFSDDDEYCSPV